MSSQDYAVKLERLRERIDKNVRLSQANKRILQKFSREMKLNDYSHGRNHKLTTHIKRIAEDVEVGLEEAEKEDIKNMVEWIQGQSFSQETVRDYKVAIRVFYKWMRNGSFDSRGCPEEVDWIRTTLRKRDRKLPNNLLSEEDVKQMIKHAKNDRCEAFISVLWETGARMGELMDLTARDIDDHPHGYQVVINGKTGPRRLPLITSGPYISSWLNSSSQSSAL